MSSQVTPLSLREPKPAEFVENNNAAPVENSRAIPLLSMEDIQQELGSIRVLVNRDRARLYTEQADSYEQSYEIAQNREVASYRDSLLVAFTVASVVLQTLSIIALASPSLIKTGADVVGSVTGHNPFIAPAYWINQGNHPPAYNYDKLSETTSKIFSAFNAIQESLKQLHETRKQGYRLESSSLAQRNKQRMDRCQQDELAARREIDSGFKDHEQMVRSREQLTQVLCRA